MTSYGDIGRGWNVYSGNEMHPASEAAGGGQPHNNMPPYLAVYTWHRIAQKESNMTDTIIVALITGGLSLLGVIITSNKTTRDVQAKLDKQQAVTDTKLDELTREVREHNNFARRVPVLEEQIKVANHRIEDLERLSNH